MTRHQCQHLDHKAETVHRYRGAPAGTPHVAGSSWDAGSYGHLQDWVLLAGSPDEVGPAGTEQRV